MGFAHASPIENLLDTEDFTLQQLLEEDDIVQECKQLNKKLIDYLACPEQVEALIDYVVTEPPEDSEGKVKFIYPYKSSEVLAADLAAVHDCLFSNEALLDKLFAFLDRDAPLNTLLAGYFGKIVSTLLARRPDETLKVMERRNLVPHLLRHLGAYSILELLLKLVSEVEEKENQGSAQMEWLYSQDLVGKLIGKLDPAQDSDVHANSAVALVGFISQQQQMHWSASLPSAQSRFTASLVDSESVRALLQKLLSGSPSTLEHGLTVLVELVRHSTSAARAAHGSSSAVVVEVLNRMGDLVEVLRSPPATPAIINTTGKLDPPLGQNRLKILEVLLALVSLKSPAVEAKLIELSVLPTVLDLFFKYEWHNLLHNLVKSLLEIIIKGENRAMSESLLTDGKMLTRIIDAHKDNDEAVKQPKSCRKGYMGQLRQISNLIQDRAKEEAWMRTYTQGPEWVNFCDTYLAQLNDVNDGRQLGRAHANGLAPQSDGEEEEEDDTPIPLDTNFDSQFEFRSPDQPDELFDNDADSALGRSAADGDVEFESGIPCVDNDMDLDAADAAQDDAELTQLAEGVKALRVDGEEHDRSSSAASQRSPGAGDDKDTLPDSPDYNDINFWRPNPFWFGAADD